MTSLNGKSAIVTGASRGIGAAAARALAEAGANVVLAARSSDEITQVAREIEANGGTAKAVTCDVTSFDDVSAMVATCKEAFGRVDILVNNAGLIDPDFAAGRFGPRRLGSKWPM
jgi:3-oxoacyl-[acyl-carrier protein] reductase